MPKVEMQELQPYWQTTDEASVKLWQGSVLDVLPLLPAKSIHVVPTSPPYWRLRDYGTGEWVGGRKDCDHRIFKGGNGERSLKQVSNSGSQYYQKSPCPKCGATRIDEQIGSEKIPDCESRKVTGFTHLVLCGKCYVCKMVAVFREVRRILRDDGVAWINLGDTYACKRNDSDWLGGRGIGDNKSNRVCPELPEGNLVGIPWRVALALQADGWVLRQDDIFSKKNCMPESVQNRCTKSHEYIFQLTKGMDYWFDGDAIKEPARTKYKSSDFIPKSEKDSKSAGKKTAATGASWNGRDDVVRDRDSNKRSVWEIEDETALLQWMQTNHPELLAEYLEQSGNKESVWWITTESYPGAHFACVDEETEALTRNGWKRQGELRDGEEILAYDKFRDRLVWQEAVFKRYPYDGNLVSFDKRDTSQLLTPNHRCLVVTRDGYSRVKRADEVNRGDSFLMTAKCQEEPTQSIGEDMASLIGWYTSEGNEPNKTYQVYIYQSGSANPEKVLEIESILKRLGACFERKVRKRIYKRTGQVKIEVKFAIRGAIARKLRQLCPSKSILDSLTRLPKNELRCLLSAFISGDGHIREDKRRCIIQKDKKRIDQLQIIAIKLGYRTILSRRKDDGFYCLYLTCGRLLNVRGTNGVWNGTQTKPYMGTVWCPKVKSGFWMARRNGKPFITGNTFPKKLVEPCILSSTSEKGCCPECGQGWVRVKSGPLGGTTGKDWRDGSDRQVAGNTKPSGQAMFDDYKPSVTLGWRPACTCYGVNRIGDFPGRKKGESDGKYNQRVKGWYEVWERYKIEYEEILSDPDNLTPAIVFDPFMGSGTTAVTALQHGRHCWGVELSKEYLDKNCIPRISGWLKSRMAVSHLVPR